MKDGKSTVTGLVKSLSNASKELVKTTKLNMDLSSKESELKSIYIEIGKKVHEIYAYGGSLGEFFDEKYQSILLAEQQLAELKNSINIAKGVKNCGSCGKQVERSATFCPKCGGSSFDPLSEFQAKTAEAPVPEAARPAAAETSGYAAAPSPEPIAPAPIVPEPVVVEPAKPAKKKCPLCGYEDNADGDRFCLSCGRML